jgi:hypothetical protein
MATTAYSKLTFLITASDSMSGVLKEVAKNTGKSLSKIEKDIVKFGQHALKAGAHFQTMGKQIMSTLLNITKGVADYGSLSARLKKTLGRNNDPGKQNKKRTKDAKCHIKNNSGRYGFRFFFFFPFLLLFFRSQFFPQSVCSFVPFMLLLPLFFNKSNIITSVTHNAK